MGETTRGSSIGTWKGTSTNLEMSVCSPKTGIVLIGICGRHESGWKKAEYGSHVKKLMKNVDLDETTSFLDHVYLGCTQRECKPNEIIIE